MVARTHLRRLVCYPRWLISAVLLLLCLRYLYLVFYDVLHPLPPVTEVFFHNALRVGLDPSRPPFASFDETSAYIGLEVDLGRALADEIGLSVEFIPLGFDGLHDALRTDQVDVVIAGLQPVYHQDGNHAVYSRHYFNAGLVLVGEQADITFRELAGGRVAYEFGSPADALAHQWLRRVQPFELSPYELSVYALDALRLQQADYALVDALQARVYLQAHPELQAGISQVTDAWYTVALRADRPNQLRLINRALNTLADNGTLDALIQHWL